MGNYGNECHRSELDEKEWGMNMSFQREGQELGSVDENNLAKDWAAIKKA